MDVTDFRTWYSDYFDEFVALARGDHDDASQLLTWWGAPLVFGTAAGCVYLMDDAAVLAALQQQVDGLRAAGYIRTEERSAETTVLNASCVLHRVGLVRLRSDGTVIAAMDVTYLVTEGPQGRRFSAVIIH